MLLVRKSKDSFLRLQCTCVAEASLLKPADVRAALHLLLVPVPPLCCQQGCGEPGRPRSAGKDTWDRSGTCIALQAAGSVSKAGRMMRKSREDEVRLILNPNHPGRAGRSSQAVVFPNPDVNKSVGSVFVSLVWWGMVSTKQVYTTVYI